MIVGVFMYLSLCHVECNAHQHNIRAGGDHFPAPSFYHFFFGMGEVIAKSHQAPRQKLRNDRTWSTIWKKSQESACLWVVRLFEKIVV